MSHQSENSTARVFFALWPSNAERDRLAAWQAPLKKSCGGRAVRGDMLHATLVFLGNIEQSRLEALQLAAQEVDGESFGLCLDEARYWGHNRIVYAVPRHLPEQLIRLVSVLEQRLKTHHFEFDQREYKPHVTLLRNARWSDAPLPAMPPVCWQIRDFALVQSINLEYRVLARFPLK